MRLEDITAEVRPRAPWEAVDLGFLMARTGWRPLARIWLSLILPLIVLVHLLLYEHLLIASVVTWWLKPLYDRLYLYYYSRALFGETPTVRDTFRALPGLLKSGLFTALTLYRFDLARSFNLPVWQLEGLRGKPRRARIRLLQKQHRGTAQGLTFACVNLELVLDLGLLFLILLFIPQHLDFGLPEMINLQQDAAWAQLLANAFYVVAIAVIEPCYVAAGFALYLNRRTLLEGWDIELAFRRLASRLATQTASVADAAHSGARRIIATVLLTGLLLGLGGAPAPALATPSAGAPAAIRTSAALAATATDAQAHDNLSGDDDPGDALPADNTDAADTAATPVRDKGAVAVQAGKGEIVPTPDKAQAKQLVQDVLARKEFGYWKTIKSWHYLGKTDKPDKPEHNADLGFWRDFTGLLARFGEVMLWGLVIGLVVLLIVYRERWLALFRAAPRRRRPARPEMLFGMDVRPESLPDDIPGQARTLWAQGEWAAALSLLYRGALATLIDRDRLELEAGATEGDCLRRVETSPGGELAVYFARLTRAWQRTAYAHRPPGAEEALGLLDSWARYFAAPAGAAAPGTTNGTTGGTPPSGPDKASAA